jgi:hypothetical protein
MPDGTIGWVGGIATKLKAAAKAGIRRVLVPAYLRFEKDAKSGEDVDLRRLGASLQIELIPVENVAQAYRLLHGNPLPVAAEINRDTLDLSEATEDALKSQYNEYAAIGTKLWDAIPEAEKTRLGEDAFAKALVVDARTKAEKAYRVGRLLYATDMMWGWALGLEALKDVQAAFTEIKPEEIKRGDLRALLKRYDELLNRATGSIPTRQDLLIASQKVMPESASGGRLHQFVDHRQAGLA